MNVYRIDGIPVSDELYHHGILGQKWGVRRYQNPDGTLTTEGKARYGKGEEKRNAKMELSVKRGEKLISKGRTRKGAIARGVGRQALIEIGEAAATAALAAAGGAMMLSSPAALPLITAGSIAVHAMKLGTTGMNVVKTAKQYKDITRAESATFLRNGGVRR